jgi:NADPH:quinone reductase-like Zn-dependent oxidoreductase
MTGRTCGLTLNLAGFQAGKTVLAPAIGGSVGVTQLARALGAKHAISSTTSHAIMSSTACWALGRPNYVRIA